MKKSCDLASLLVMTEIFVLLCGTGKFLSTQPLRRKIGEGKPSDYLFQSRHGDQFAIGAVRSDGIANNGSMAAANYSLRQVISSGEVSHAAAVVYRGFHQAKISTAPSSQLTHRVQLSAFLRQGAKLGSKHYTLFIVHRYYFLHDSFWTRSWCYSSDLLEKKY
jgi:hypothetical protein